MQISWKPDGRPEAANRIAGHTAMVIRDIDKAASNSERRKLFADWMKFAKDNRVCQMIVDHMLDKRAEMLADENKPVPQSRPVARNVTGEREDA